MYTLPPLPYDYDALEPHIDEHTMRLHHDKHHQAYVDGLNAALTKLEAARQSGDFGLVKHLAREVAFHGSGHSMHCVFWAVMCPANQSGQPDGALTAQLQRDFGSVDNAWAQFAAASKAVEGSGWGLLVWEPIARRTLVLTAEKHQNLTMQGVLPLLVLDVWEHAYYLKYQNNRAAYVDAFRNIIDWAEVARRLESARQYDAGVRQAWSP
jgi:Fe-Mn family superoxide dismutase